MVAKTSSDEVYEPVADFYAGKSVFITGGTGFLGKVFIEKLLYSCPDIDKIYMLIRDKRGMNSAERVKDFINNPIFSKLKVTRPTDLDKIVSVAGDIALPNLGLSPIDEETLVEKVSVIIHSAATIKFNEPLKEAWNTNVEGTKTMLDLSRRMKNIEVFIHISTAFTNTDRQVVDEILYPAPADIEDMYLKIKDGVTAAETRKILKGRPNTYTFTKAITEHLVAENHGFVPTIIIRPSVVTAAKEHPIKGWLENWYGATGLATSTAKGMNRIVHGVEDNIIDLIPVDYVANVVIISGARSGMKSNEVSIYNCCTSDCNPITLGKILRTFKEDTIKYDNTLLHVPIVFTTYRWLIPIVTILFQIIPAYMADTWRQFMGKRPRYIKLQSLVIQTRDALAYFTSHSWLMKASAVRRLNAGLSASDRAMFPCDPADIHWDEYMADYCWGVRRFLEHKI